MSKWSGKTKGSLLGYKFFIWLIDLAGLRVSYFFLRIVSFHYFLFSKTSNEVLLSFYKEHLRYSHATARQLVRKNYFNLAQSILDRIAFSMGKASSYTFDNSKGKHLIPALKEEKGIILVSAHVSNWAVAGEMLGSYGKKINVLMFENEHRAIKNFLDKKKKDSGFHVIELKEDMSHIIKVHLALKNGEVICMHGDRFLEGARTLSSQFIDEEALFPSGPFSMIKKLNASYSFVFTAKTSARNYDFWATHPKKPDGNELDILKEYVDELEKCVERYPDQWFNYHDFYDKPNAS